MTTVAMEKRTLMKTSDKLIRASEALRMINNSKADNPYTGTIAGPVWNIAHDSSISCIEACEAAAVKEAVYGQWLVPDKYYPDTCSKCKFEFIWDGDDDYLPKYCPECGTIMTGRRFLY